MAPRPGNWARLWPRSLPKAVPFADREAPQLDASHLWNAWRMRWTRRRLLARAVAKRRQLAPVADRTHAISADDILCFVCLRNEAARLPFFLDHHRRLGVQHFQIVDNASNDGSASLLADQADVSVWRTEASYKASRFGLDWLTWLMIRHGHGHWCLTLDVDETLIYPDWEGRDLRALTGWLDVRGQRSFGALMLDLYPKGPLGSQEYVPGTDPSEVLEWFDAGPYTEQYQPRTQSQWVQGGARARMFFSGEPARAPTLNKVPLVRWNRRYVYINSTHAVLPPPLNAVWDENGQRPTGALLHSKFLPEIRAKSAEEKQRGEHFANSALYDAYYDRLTQGPDLWHEAATRYRDWRQLQDLGLIAVSDWDEPLTLQDD